MSILVCVTGQKSCERLIRRGAELAREAGVMLNVLHVVRTDGSVLGFVNEPEALEYLLRVSVENDASMYVRRSDNVAEAIETASRNEQVSVIVMGMSPGKKGTTLLDEVARRLPQVRLEILEPE